jgi:Protein kinase domain
VGSTTLTGAELAGYRIEAVAGRGGMGVVYRAWHLGLERPVALKVISPDLASRDEFRRRFRRESRLAAALDHPNVLPLYEAGNHDGVLYIAMRWVDGTDLGHLLHDEAPTGLEVDRGVRLVEQVAGALDAAHARGLVHRDVKPANVLLASEGDGEHAYLADFGLAKRESTGGLTETGRWLGTADYAAPEQIEGGKVGPDADVYALGAVLYAVLTGQPPFPRESAVAVAYAQIHDAPPRPSALRAGLPRGLDSVVTKAMAKRPDERFASAGELATAARAALSGESAPQVVRAPRVLRAPRVWTLAPPLRGSDEELATHPLPEAVSAPAGPEAVATRKLPSKPRRRRRRVIAGTLASLLLVAAAGLAGAVATGTLKLPSFARVVGIAHADTPLADASGETVRCTAARCSQDGRLVQTPREGAGCTRLNRSGTWTRIDAAGHNPMLACVPTTADPALAAVHPRVPDLAGARLDLAEQFLDRSGIRYETDGGGLLGVIIPENWTVCSTDPGGGARLGTDSAVTLSVDGSC